ncbi:hypothetical protein [Mycobacteroides abscessus]|uniref:hypothetical protein n=1 Tax=Mycobacteroides abscessus TaxID=36809 RepID=UPI0009A8117D|nr:hypothetical protein [Mycobacteroides abscessus]MDO3029749.1 hypothetical protein [Mycobacteroides abscessus subsp. massiliense]PVA58981.1 hypothetical protein DDJ72_09325 [Mycobacteroides abscessus]RIU39581.1 hypothetical protein D2E93_24060 [Mycobacteroides abscessus]SKU47150.1 Uncharacterised protein [Mycobacteroides abscessus subsp. massiliense]SKU69619.1 Uncharacterised protein [Mycobacteroides abscessus subsp. massiliense]
MSDLDETEIERLYWTPPPWKDEVMADAFEASRLAELYLLRDYPPTDEDGINFMFYLEELGYILRDDYANWLKGIRFAVEQRGWEWNRQSFLRLCN